MTSQIRAGPDGRGPGRLCTLRPVEFGGFNSAGEDTEGPDPEHGFNAANEATACGLFVPDRVASHPGVGLG
jgi:hypothetical protein